MKAIKLTGLAAAFLLSALMTHQADAATSLNTPISKINATNSKTLRSAAQSLSASADNTTGQNNSSSSRRGKTRASAAERVAALKALGAAPASANVLQRLKNAAVPAPTRSRSIIQKTVLEPVDMDTRVRVYTDTFPATAVVTILFQNNDGEDVKCSGALIAEDLVLTAGHCLHDGISGEEGWYEPATYQIIPGVDGSTQPFVTCEADGLASVLGWVEQGRDDYDYGVIHLTSPIGQETGWFGFFNRGQKNHEPATISGYPSDKEDGQQWWSHNNIAKRTGRKLFYKNDTEEEGMSGSPIWMDKAPNRHEDCPSGGPCIEGIHGYGAGELDGNKWYQDYNSGVNINGSVLRNLLCWKNQVCW